MWKVRVDGMEISGLKTKEEADALRRALVEPRLDPVVEEEVYTSGGYLQRLKAETKTVYAVQEDYEGGIAGLFTREADADAFLAAIAECGLTDYSVNPCAIDKPAHCPPVAGFEVARLEGDDARSSGREIVGDSHEFAVLQIHGMNQGLIYARATRATEAEARAAVDELIATKRAELDKDSARVGAESTDNAAQADSADVVE